MMSRRLGGVLLLLAVAAAAQQKQNPSIAPVQIQNSGKGTIVGVNNGTVNNNVTNINQLSRESLRNAVRAAVKEAMSKAPADPRLKQLNDLVETGKVDEALELNAVLRREHTETVAADNHLQALLYELKNEPALALPFHRAAFDSAPDDPGYAGVYAAVLLQSGDAKQALGIYTKLVAQLKQGGAKYDGELVLALAGEASCNSFLKRYDDWNTALLEMIKTQSRLAHAHPDQVGPAAVIFSEMGLDLAKPATNDDSPSADETFGLQLKYLNLILDTYLPLARKQPAKYEPVTGDMYEAIGTIELAREILKILKLDEDSYKFPPETVKTAETHLRSAVEILERVYRRNPGISHAEGLMIDTPLLLSYAQTALGNLYGSTGRPSLGEPLFLVAIRRLAALAAGGSRKYQLYYGSELLDLGRFYFGQNRFLDSRKYAEDAVGVLSKLDNQGPSAINFQNGPQGPEWNVEFTAGQINPPSVTHLDAAMLVYKNLVALKAPTRETCTALNADWTLVRETSQEEYSVAELTAQSIRSGVCSGEGRSYLKEPAVGPALQDWAAFRCIAERQDCTHISDFTGQLYGLQPDAGTQSLWEILMSRDLDLFHLMSLFKTWDCGPLEQVIEHASGGTAPLSTPSVVLSPRKQAMFYAAAAVREGHCSLDSMPVYKKLTGAAAQ